MTDNVEKAPALCVQQVEYDEVGHLSGIAALTFIYLYFQRK